MTGREQPHAADPEATPLYSRVLRLRHVQPGGLLRFLFLEGVIFVAVLLSLAELVSWWSVLVFPAAVALMVKVNDMLAGGIARAVAHSPSRAGKAVGRATLKDQFSPAGQSPEEMPIAGQPVRGAHRTARWASDGPDATGESPWSTAGTGASWAATDTAGPANPPAATRSAAGPSGAKSTIGNVYGTPAGSRGTNGSRPSESNDGAPSWDPASYRGPSHGDSANPAAAIGESINPGSITSESITAGSTTSGLTTSGPITGGSTTSGPITGGSTTSGSITGGPTTSGSTTSGSINAGSTTSGSINAGSTNPASTNPGPGNPGSSNPESNNPESNNPGAVDRGSWYPGSASDGSASGDAFDGLTGGPRYYGSPGSETGTPAEAPANRRPAPTGPAANGGSSLRDSTFDGLTGGPRYYGSPGSDTGTTATGAPTARPPSTSPANPTGSDSAKTSGVNGSGAGADNSLPSSEVAGDAPAAGGEPRHRRPKR